MRRQGPIALEQVEVDDPFIKRGIRMIADGFSAEAIRASLERERDLDYERIDDGHKIFKAFGEAAPGMGMVGTLIGLVSMFGHMDDPKKIGPGMAIALLTTLYGAVLSNVVFLPIADKLANRAEEEGTNRTPHDRSAGDDPRRQEPRHHPRRALELSAAPHRGASCSEAAGSRLDGAKKKAQAAAVTAAPGSSPSPT